MSRLHVIGLIILLAGVGIYFLVDGEPYTTIAGFIGGIGLGVALFGPKLVAKHKK